MGPHQGLVRAPVRPRSRAGRFESGSKFSLHGRVGTAPFVWPSRDYLVYVPAGRPRLRRAPLLVLLHGCRQTPEEFAQGTRIAAFADRTGCVVLLPRQKEHANPWRCWNWFESRTTAGKGEAAIVAAQIRRVRRRYRIDRKRVLAAGMSAGGALAAVIGVRYPDLVRGVAVHSGLACGAASSPLTALGVMQRGPTATWRPSRRGAHGGRAARCPRAAPRGARRGRRIVAPRNASRSCGSTSGSTAIRRPRRATRRRCPRPTSTHRRARRMAAARRSGNGDATAASSPATWRSTGSATRGAAATRSVPYNDARAARRDRACRRFLRRCLILTAIDSRGAPRCPFPA